MASIETCMRLADALTEATVKVKDARQALLEAVQQKARVKEILKDKEAELLNGGLVKGTNDKLREASLYEQTRTERIALRCKENIELDAILALEVAKDERRNLENLLRIEELT